MMQFLYADLKLKLALIILLIVPGTGAFAQSPDTIYLDGNGKKAQRSQYTYYRVIVKSNDGLYECKDYWKSGELEMRGQLSSLYPETREGKFVWYYKTGVVRTVINYNNGVETGLIQSFDVNGNMDAEYCGNLDSLDNGAEIKRAINNFWHYTARKLKYPENEIRLETEGTVRAEFVLNREGKVERLKVKKSVSEKIDAEALRVIRAYDKWPAPMYKGNTTMLLCVLPIVFQLN